MIREEWERWRGVMDNKDGSLIHVDSLLRRRCWIHEHLEQLFVDFQQSQYVHLSFNSGPQITSS